MMSGHAPTPVLPASFLLLLSLSTISLLQELHQVLQEVIGHFHSFDVVNVIFIN